MKTKVGLIGLGLMGNPMAKNILKGGFPLYVYNRNKAKTLELQKLGAIVAKSPKELSSKVDVVITMVTGPKDIKDCLFGKDGAVKGSHAGLTFIDMSTIGKKAAEEIGKKLESFNMDFIDAPVTGGTVGAISGELVIYVGGKESVFEKVKPVLLSMGKTLHYIGPTGSGQAVKLINNHLIAAGMIALSEGMVLADMMKVPRSVVCNALQSAPIVSTQMIRVMPNYINNDFPIKFSIANLKKDLSLAKKEINNKNKSLKILSTTEKMYKEAINKKLGGSDYSEIIKMVEMGK